MSDMQIGAGLLSNAITIKPQQGRASECADADNIPPVPDEIPAMRGESVAIRDARSVDEPPHSQQSGADKRRRTRAIGGADTNTDAPASQLIGAGNGSGSERATRPADTQKGPPIAANTEISGRANTDRHRATAAEGEGAYNAAPTKAASPPHPAIPALIQLQRRRQFAIRTAGALDRATGSFVAAYIHTGDGPPGKETFARVAKIVRAVETGAPASADASPRKSRAKALTASDTIATDDTALAETCAPIILGTKLARAPFEAIRADAEREMVRLAKTLPVWEWSQTVRGLGALGIAIIAAAASGPRGDVGSFATKERLWKRLGLAVIDGERQRRISGDAALAHGYNPRRRAEIWTIADSLFRHQWAGAKDDVAAHPIGPYGRVYMKRKAHTAGRVEWRPARCEADARRIMSKALVEDYWRVWRGMEPLNHD